MTEEAELSIEAVDKNKGLGNSKLSKFGKINERIQEENNIDLPNFLKTEYVDNKRSTWEIGLELGISTSTVRGYMEKLNIPRRQGSDARVKNRQDKQKI